jgi:hypothetical protein
MDGWMGGNLGSEYFTVGRFRSGPAGVGRHWPGGDPDALLPELMASIVRHLSRNPYHRREEPGPAQ